MYLPIEYLSGKEIKNRLEKSYEVMCEDDITLEEWAPLYTIIEDESFYNVCGSLWAMRHKRNSQNVIKVK